MKPPKLKSHWLCKSWDEVDSTYEAGIALLKQGHKVIAYKCECGGERQVYHSSQAIKTILEQYKPTTRT